MTETATPLAPASATDVVVPLPTNDASKTPAPPPAAAAEPAKDGTQQPDAAPDNQENPEPKPKRPASERISELYAQKKAAERRADEAIRIANHLREQLERPSSIDPNDFNAQEIDRVRKAVKAERYEQTVDDARAALQARLASTTELFQNKVQEARERIPDLDTVLPKFGQIRMSDEICELIAESDKAVEIAYRLASDKKLSDVFVQMSPLRQAAEIARIEADVKTAPTARKTSNAPPPVPTINGASAPTGRKDPSEMSMEEYAAFYADRRKARR